MITTGLFGLLAAVTLTKGTVDAAIALHLAVLVNVLRSSVGFFDVTPLGRVLNRFSKDTDAIDNALPKILSGFCYCFFKVAGTVLVIACSTPWTLTALIPIGIFYCLVQVLWVGLLFCWKNTPLCRTHNALFVVGTEYLVAYWKSKNSMNLGFSIYFHRTYILCTLSPLVKILGGWCHGHIYFLLYLWHWMLSIFNYGSQNNCITN